MGRGWLVAWLMAAWVWGGCGAAPVETITLTGSSTIAPMMAELGRRFEERHPGVRVDVQAGGSSRGITDARSGVADLGMVSRELKAEEADLQGFVVARDGICVIAHEDNPVAGLTRAQVVAIYKDEINDWKEVGGAPGPITVVQKAEGRSTLELFMKFFALDAKEVKPDVVIGDNEQGIKTVVGNPGAIGYVSVGSAEHDAKAGVPIRLLPVDGVVPSMAAVRDGSFPSGRPLHLVSKGEPQGSVKALIAFVRAPENHDLIEAQFFVPAAQ